MQVVILHKEIAYKIAETMHFAEHRSPRAAGSRRRAAQKTPSNVEGANAGVVFHPTTGVCGVAPVVEFSPFLEHFGVGEQVAAFSVLVVHLFHCYQFLSFLYLYYTMEGVVCHPLFFNILQCCTFLHGTHSCEPCCIRQ